MLQVIVDRVAGGDDSDGFIKKNLLFWPRVNCHFIYVVEEGPSEEVLGCNEREDMDLNMCETLSTCTYIEESVPGPYITINSVARVKGLGD